MNQELNRLLWITEFLPDDVVTKRMHGGIGYYWNETLYLILVEASKTREYRGIGYPFEIWNGCLFPIVRLKQNTVFAKFPFLENHPASEKWLYLPAESQDFEDEVRAILREIKKGNPLFGMMVPIAKPKRGSEELAEDEDLSKPRSFSDEAAPAPKKKVLAKKKAIGPKKKVKGDKKTENNMLLSVLKRRN